MIAEISCKEAFGEVTVIPSKSAAHRLLISAALADVPTEIVCNASSKDIAATVRCLNSLGAEICERDGVYFVTPIKKKEKAEAFCGESGSTLRFLVPVAAALGGEVTFDGEGRLPTRPMQVLVECMEENGAEIEYNGILPLTTRGGMKSGKYKIPGNISSQFISGLIFALPLLSGDSIIEISGKIESLPYIEMTLDSVKKFGIRAEFSENTIKIPGGQKYTSPGRLTVEGDWSNAAFWLCLGALSEKGITCHGIKKDSIQGDREIVNILKRFGAEVNQDEESVTVRKGKLSGISIDAVAIPDLAPIITVVASVSEGETVIYNAERLRIKESDRIESTVAMLKNLGGESYPTEDGIRVIGKEKLSGGKVDSFNDHRIAMSAAISAAVCSGAVTIMGAEAANKSYGDFFERYASLGAAVNKREVQ